jgi:hypothetical protein
VVQDDTDFEILIGELATKPDHYFELDGLLYLSQHGFVVGLNTFLAAQPEVSKIPAVQVPPQNIQRDSSFCAHIIILLFATEAEQHGVRQSKLILEATVVSPAAGGRSPGSSPASPNDGSRMQAGRRPVMRWLPHVPQSQVRLGRPVISCG